MPTSLPILNPAHVVDAVIVFVVALYIRDDLRRGVLFGLLDLFGFGLALVAALLLYAPVAAWLVERTELPYALAKPAAFGAIWVGSDVLVALTLRRLLAWPALEVAKWPLGRALGLFTGAARGGMALMLTLGLMSALPLPEPVIGAVAESRTGSYLRERGADLEGAIAGVVGDAVQETLSMLTVRPESGERVDLRFTVAQPRIDEPVEARMLELVNRERARAGLGALRPDAQIREVARAYSVEMFRLGFFAHVDPSGASPFDRMRRGGVRFAAAGENLALAPTVDVAHDGLMNSPGHRANILNGRFGRIGIGVADGGLHGKMFTQNFAD